FTYTVTDEFGAIDTATVTLTIEGRNDGPVAVADTNAGAAVVEQGFGIAGNDTATGNLLANDTDVDASDVLSVTAVDSGTGEPGSNMPVNPGLVQIVPGRYGSLAIEADGTWTYNLNDADPDTNALAQGTTAQEVFTYTVDDGNGGTDTAALTIDITGTNDAPTLAAGVGVAVEDGSSVNVDLSVLGADIDSDDDGSSLTYTVTGAPGEGSASITGGTLTFDPGADFQDLALDETRDVTIQVTAKDAHGATAVNDVVITVTGTNDWPVATNDNNASDALVEQGFGVVGDSAAAGDVLANDSDVDSTDVLAVVSVMNGGNIAVPSTPGGGMSITGVYGSLALASDGTWTYALDNDDPDTEALENGDTAFEVFTYTVSDGNGGTDTATLTLEIAGSGDNVAPVAVDDTFTVTEDTPTSLTPLGNDTDANNTPVVTQALSIVSINGVAATVGAVIATTNGSITIGAGGAVDYTPNANYSGADSFSYTVNDGLEESNTGTVNLNIAPVNDTPVIAPITAIEAGFEETIVDVNDGMLGAGSSVGNPGYWYIVDFDSPAGAQTIAIERTSSHPNLSASEIPTNGVVMHINPNGGSPSDNAVTGRGDFGVSVTSYDNGVATTRPVSEITAPNYDGTPEEIYPDALSFFTSTNGIGINWVGSNIDVPGGTANVRMSLSGIDYVDGIGALTLDSVEVQVSPAIMSGQIAFDDPDIGDSHVAIATGVTLSGTTNGLPPALALAFLNVSVSSSPTAGAPGTIDWTFNPGMLGLDFLRPGESLTFDFVIEVDDAQPAWDTETLSITIHGADNLPEVFDGPQSTLEDTVLDGTSFTYEPDGEPLSFSVLTDVSNGTLVLDSITGDYSYTPDLNYNGTDSFTYLIDDGTGGIVSSTVTIDVGAVNDDPTLAAAALGTVEDAGVETVLDLTTLGDDVDVDDDPTTLEYTITGHPSEGTATLDGTDLKFDPGTAFQTLAEGETRDVVVQITATDAHNATAVNDVTITVTGTNDAPTMSNVTILTNEDAGTGSFDSSGILENGDVETLGNWLGSNYLSLENVFTKDAGDTSVDWHTAVNGVGPTITIIELDNGNIIGGYTPISWSNTTGYSLEYNSGAFLFNLSTDTQYEQGSNPHVIYNSINHGPTFGGGHDLYVNSTLTGGYGNIGYYYGDRSQAGTSEYREEFTGTYNTWTIVGLETFTLSSGAGNPVTTLDLSTIGDDIDSDDDGASLVYTITDLPNAGEATISGNTLIFNPDGEFEYLNDGENATVEIEVTATDAHGVSTSSIVTVVVEGRDEVVTVRVEESDQQHTTTAASGANGVFGGTGVDGTNGFAGSNGASANAIQLNETYVGAGNNDTLVLSADASGGNGGYGGNGGSGGSGQYLNNSYTGGNSATPADPYTNQLNYGQAGDGADGGAGGSGGTASAQLDGNLLDGQGGSDSLLFEVDAAGGIGSFGGNGGSGGFGGDTGSYGYRITNSSSWVTAYSYYQQDYNGGNHGDTGDGARGGSGGFAQAYADSNTGLGGDGDDIITVDVSAVGGLAGRGGTAQGARGNAPSVADASAGTSGDGGVGGAALAEARDNTLNGGADNDILTVIVKAEGGDGLYGGNGDAGEIGTDYLNTTNGSTGAFRGQSYTDTVYYYGDGSNGGDGGDGGDAMSRVIGNELLGGDGQDQLALEAIAVAGSGGNGGVGYATSDGGPYGGNRTYSYVGGDAGATGQAGVQGDATAIVTGNILSGGADDDTLSVSFGLSGRYNSLTFDGNTFDGGAGFDTLDLSGIAVSTGLAGAQTSVGAVIDMAAETLVVGGSGSNTVTGIEYLVGTQGDDVITGTNSADRINASGGADVITLGAGADVFEFSDGHNTITDFDIAEDRIQLGGNNLSFGFVDRDFNGVVNASDPTTVGTGGYNFSNDGAGNLVITVSDDPSRQVTLVGVTELYEDDFIF
ncbi:PEP_CTERM-anchored TLD domain-containing protein, partial [Pelagimonas varians]